MAIIIFIVYIVCLIFIAGKVLPRILDRLFEYTEDAVTSEPDLDGPDCAFSTQHAMEEYVKDNLAQIKEREVSIIDFLSIDTSRNKKDIIIPKSNHYDSWYHYFQENQPWIDEFKQFIQSPTKCGDLRIAIINEAEFAKFVNAINGTPQTFNLDKLQRLVLIEGQIIDSNSVRIHISNFKAALNTIYLDILNFQMESTSIHIEPPTLMLTLTPEFREEVYGTTWFNEHLHYLTADALIYEYSNQYIGGDNEQLPKIPPSEMMPSSPL